MIIADSRDPSVRAGLALSLRLGMIASKRFECDFEPVDQQNTGEAKLGEPESKLDPLQPAWLPLQVPRWNLNFFAPVAVSH